MGVRPYFSVQAGSPLPNKKQKHVALRFEVSQVPKSEAPGAPSIEVSCAAGRQCWWGTEKKQKCKAHKTTADPSTHHPQAEERLGPRSLRMTAECGPQFHARRVGEAGGELKRNKRGPGGPRYSRPGGRRYSPWANAAEGRLK